MSLDPNEKVKDMTIDPRVFRNTMGCFATGVTVVTADLPSGERVGLTVNSFSSVSLEPPLVLFNLGRDSSTVAAFEVGKPFVVNMLSENQRDVSMAFASRGSDPFKAVEWTLTKNGGASLVGCLANVECTVTKVIDGGDHVIVMGRVIDLSYTQAGQPLVYFRGGYVDLNH